MYPGLRLMGFKPRSALKSYLHIKTSCFIYPDEQSIKVRTFPIYILQEIITRIVREALLRLQRFWIECLQWIRLVLLDWLSEPAFVLLLSFLNQRRLMQMDVRFVSKFKQFYKPFEWQTPPQDLSFGTSCSGASLCRRHPQHSDRFDA